MSIAQAGATWAFLGRGIIRIGCTGSHKLVVLFLGRDIFPANSRVKLLLLHVHAHFACAGSRSWSAAFSL